MKSLVFKTIPVLALLSLSPWAATTVKADSTFIDYAPVTEVVPLVSRRQISTPRETCELVRSSSGGRSERYSRQTSGYSNRHQGGDSLVPTLLGGIIGGAIGNQFGGGNGKKVMTVIGAMAGASIASESTSTRYRTHRDGDRQRRYSRNDQDRYVERCRVFQDVEEVEQITGYQVSYEYMGRTFTRTVDEPPGDHIRVQVELEPMVEPAYVDIATSM